MVTIDTSVWMNGDAPNEPHHAHSRAFLDYIAAQKIGVIVPTLLRAETAGAISRVRKNQFEAQEFSRKIALVPFIRWIALDDKLAAIAANLAAVHRLRGADAVYAAVALEHHCKLVSLDNEHLTHLVGILDVFTPADALAQLTKGAP